MIKKNICALSKKHILKSEEDTEVKESNSKKGYKKSKTKTTKKGASKR